MCGIVGYSGEKNASELLPSCLRKLDYRGYDSFGFAVQANPTIAVEKHAGRLDGFTSQLPESKLGIAHTRWATHGSVTEKNAHPHMSCDGSIAVVHNGIIENYSELREQLKQQGHKFVSETDSEVIPHLIEGLLAQGKSFEEAVRETCDSLQGTFALLILNKESNKLVAARKGSPLVIGVGKNENFVASDVTAFIEFTKDVIFLDDNELAIVDGNVEVQNFSTGKKLDKKVSKIEWDAEQAEKSGYKHFMLKEIFEQPEAAQKCLQGRIKDGKVVLPELEGRDEKLKEINRVIIVACGTSWHAGLVAEYIMEELVGLPVEVEYASEFRYRNPIVDDKCLVIVVSQSGETADTLAALREAKKKGALVISICNVMGSTIARESHSTIYNRAGPEIGVASTKAFTTQLIVLTLVSLYLADLIKSNPLEKQREILSALQEIPDKMQQTVDESNQVLAIAKKYWEKPNALYLGRGPNFPIALEGALKLKEISYLHAEGMSAAEMKHGPIALIDSDMPAIFVAVKDKTYNKILANIEEIKARGGTVIAVASPADKEMEGNVAEVMHIAKTIELLQPLLTVLPLQLLAYYIADIRECDIDKPRNLAKSVTVE
ncbi:MAG: glutamine--fructose-6-phosphate transaminase (isomerizing) [Candidatus Diapherotrites archaeon]|uniref:Glutamine--fructose-6-phosphate aminotransferase [isomerizing] n=1 Tax=Candidatus Iainarchaeum sp. TaxID=3101447 RepID=A0A2D6M137_9ARCH|nr:glutamine--fructose-6-phosphate transaminase (isomerizing) [Candidatus Diapherotrites archaeon]|tara:strand:+ start:5310 stop:7124 length:1815 start_codon:yes stop_codon:yes gene_type:complete